MTIKGGGATFPLLRRAAERGGRRRSTGAGSPPKRRKTTPAFPRKGRASGKSRAAGESSRARLPLRRNPEPVLREFAPRALIASSLHSVHPVRCFPGGRPTPACPMGNVRSGGRRKAVRPPRELCSPLWMSPAVLPVQDARAPKRTQRAPDVSRIWTRGASAF